MFELTAPCRSGMRSPSEKLMDVIDAGSGTRAGSAAFPTRSRIAGRAGSRSAVGEMGEKVRRGAWSSRPGAVEVRRADATTEVWISEAQERMVLRGPAGRDKLAEAQGAVRGRGTWGSRTSARSAAMMRIGRSWSLRDLSRSVSCSGRPRTWSFCTTACRSRRVRPRWPPPPPEVTPAAPSAAETSARSQSSGDVLGRRCPRRLLGDPNIASKRWVDLPSVRPRGARRVLRCQAVGGARSSEGPGDASVLRAQGGRRTRAYCLGAGWRRPVG